MQLMCNRVKKMKKSQTLPIKMMTQQRNLNSRVMNQYKPTSWNLQ